jgi:aryl-alcohol dehydrogenase-like predicted oxidoreductase
MGIAVMNGDQGGIQMESRKLGSSGIPVSEIGLGCWPIGGASFRGGKPTGWSGVDVMESIETVRLAWKQGITFYDTADAYGRGKSEVLVGMGLYEHKTDAVVCTKVGMSLAAPGQNFSEPYIQGALDASLTRLERDYVDLYLLHGPPLDQMGEPLFGLMDSLKASGKIKAWGVSISPVDTSDKVVEEGMRAIEGGADAIQLVYNILQQAEGDILFPVAEEKGVGIIVRVPLASGWLTGKYNEHTVFPDDDLRSLRYTPGRVQETARKVAQLDFLMEEAESMAEAAIRFVLSQSAVSTVIPGAKNPGQLAALTGAAGKTLSETALRKIKEVTAK